MTYDRTSPPDRRLHWVLLANASRARLFERDHDNGALRELGDFVHPGSRLKSAALSHDRAGQGSKGSARAHFEPPTSPKEREQQHFAEQLSQHLEEAARAERLVGWAVIASSPFLGRLRTALGSAAATRLTHHVDRDLTACVGQELEQRVTELLLAHPSSDPGGS
ncbi:MAG: host attachment protein [Burkholderiales bacterium]|nr:host attachment protein [Burkholderiales bacterium]